MIYKFSSEGLQKLILFCNKFCNFSLRLSMDMIAKIDLRTGLMLAYNAFCQSRL
jgi:hypothetical protein